MNSDMIIDELSLSEIDSVSGGFGPVAAWTIAIGIGALAVAAYSAGYELGKDLAT